MSPRDLEEYRFRERDEFEEEEEVEEELREEEEEVAEVHIRAEVPTSTPPCILLSVAYDGKAGRALCKLYDPSSGKIYFWYDNTGHKPYLLTNVPPEELVKKYRNVIMHKGFDHIEVVKKYDPLHDREVIVTKVVAKDPLSIGGARESIREMLPKTWESKIKYHLCYIYDRQLIPGMFYRIENGNLVKVPIEVPSDVKEKVYKLYEGDPEYQKLVDEWLELFQAPVPNIRRVAIDIEVFSPAPNKLPNPKDAHYEVIAVAMASNDGVKRVLLLERPSVEIGERPPELPEDVKIEFYKSERELLREVFRVLLEYPVVLTFNGDAFDLQYLYNRALRLGFTKEEIPIIPRRNYMDLAIGIHVDLYKFFSNRAIQAYAFGGRYQEVKTLDAIAQALLNVGKITLEKHITELTYMELANYCFRDAWLTLQLTTFNNDLVMKLIVLLMRISKLPMEDLTRSAVSAWIKNMLYFEHRKRNYLIPEKEDILSMKSVITTKAIIKGKKYMGAIVIEPPPGIFFNVVVSDFASLYPSLIKKWNLSYETVRCPHEECRSNTLPGLPHWVCRKRRGISSLLIGLLRDLRVEVYKKLAKTEKDPVMKMQYDVVQNAMKVFINASYGVFGAETFPLYCPPVAEATTALGRVAISKTIAKAQELGLTVIYGDTDSLFIWNPDPEKLKQLFEWVEEALGVDLDVDKEYRYVAFSGKKKNYLGIYRDGKVDIKGMVGKKRNTPEFLKNAFAEALNILSSVNDISDLSKAKTEIIESIRSCKRKLEKGEIPLDQLAFKVMLSKPLSDYKRTTPPHVKAAKQLKLFGIEVAPGDIIHYVKVRGKDGVKPVQLARIDEIDKEKYVSHIETTFGQLLEALGMKVDEVLRGVTTLFSYSSTS